MGSPELDTGTRAAFLKTDLELAYEGLKDPVARYSEVMGRVNAFLDRNEVHDASEEGLDQDVNELYLLWRRTPDAHKVEDTIRLKA